MSIRFTPYLSFPGTAREALDFYAGILGGTVEISTFGEYGYDDPAMKDGVMHSTFTAEGIQFHASDNNPTAEPVAAGAPKVEISLALMGSEPGDLEAIFAKLAEGGEVTMPLEKQVWGDHYGQLVDKFGVAWMVDFHDPADDGAESAPAG